MGLQKEFEKQGEWLFKYRGILPLIPLLIGTVLYIETEIHPEQFILEDTPYEIYYETLALLLSLFGLFIRVYTVGYTPVNTSGRNTTEGQVAEVLNTTGMYSIVRHPLYLGNFFLWLGPALLTGHFWFIIAFCLFYWLYYERIMFAEEQFLKRKFQSQFTEWVEKVPAFIPRFKNYVKPALPFSWKKVLKKEKNAFAAVFLIFFAFDMIASLIEKKIPHNYLLITGCIVSLLAYAVLKYLKYNTGILEEKGR
jgi:protein-S-isoprenylcysteine O-methyltransferase Ste14